MDGLKKQIGQLLQLARDARGFRSAKALADAAGDISERSIAGVESGERFGKRSINRIERALALPAGIVHRAYETGDLHELQALASTPALAGPDLHDDVERQLWAISGLSEAERWQYINQRRDKLRDQGRFGA